METTYWLVGEMEHMKVQHMKRTKAKPIAWLMSIEEHDDIRDTLLSNIKDEEKKKKFEVLEHFNGLPVYIKESRGVELAIDVNSAQFYRDERNRKKEVERMT